MNTTEYKRQTVIPWEKKQDWEQIFESIKKIDRLYGIQLKTVRKTAQKIQYHFEQISDQIDGLCSATCPGCEDVCCVRATIWFDFADLLYIYFALNNFPEKQIKKKQVNDRKICSHLNKNGCVLSRLERPFVCTWYFCPAQTDYLSVNDVSGKNSIQTHLNEIKMLRKKMEAAYIEISSGRGISA